MVRQLARAGLIVEVETSRKGQLPQRTVYGLTEAGGRELRDWLSDLVEEPRHEYPSFVAALSLIGALPPDEAVDLLHRRLARLAEIRGEISALIRDTLDSGVPELFVVEEEYRLACWTQSPLSSTGSSSVRPTRTPVGARSGPLPTPATPASRAPECSDRRCAPDMDRGAVEDAARGLAWTGADARDRGLVDELGGLERALELAKQHAGIAPDVEVDFRIVPRPSPLERLRPPESSEDLIAAAGRTTSPEGLALSAWGRLAPLAAQWGCPRPVR